MKKMFPLGCAGLGVQASSVDRPVSLQEPTIEEKFALLAESGLWDFLDHIPIHRNLVDNYIQASQKYNIPIYSGYGCYVWGAHEKEFQENIQLTAAVGGRFHNIMMAAKDSQRQYLSNEQVAEAYIYFYEYAAKHKVNITFENHVDNWSEDYRRVLDVKKLVEQRGLPFQFAMDYSHCIFKIENDLECHISFQDDQDAIRKLDPFNHDSFADDWLNANIVHWGQIRPAVPNGPRNFWSQESSPWEGYGNDRPGRGIQYPFHQPQAGEWPHQTWHAHKLASTKEVIRKLIDSYLNTPESNLQIVTVDNINLWSYGLGWKYNMFKDSCAVAQYIREIYAERCAVYEAKQRHSSQELIQLYRAS